MKWIVARVFVWLLLALAVLWLADWGVWRIRMMRGGGMGKVAVSQFQVAPLKGNKEEYYYLGTANADCSQSIFPQAGSGACWWVERHKVMFDR